MDLITVIPNFFYDGEYRYKTIMGGLLQIIITMLWFAGIIYFSKDIYLRENPSVITSNEYDRIPYERNYTNLDQFMFMISINDPFTWAPFIDETYYTVKYITMIKVNQTRGPSQPLKTERCKPEFFKGKESHIVGIPIENYFCLSPDILDVTFKGTQTSPDSKFIKIGVHMCVNSTANNNSCKTQEEINHKLAGSSFNLFFFNYKFNSKNYTQPEELFVDFHHSFYSNLYYKLVFVTMKQVRFIDDVGFFSESVHSKDYFSVDNIKEVFHFQKQADGKFLDFAVNFGSNRENVRRNYKKIQSVIAEVGGLFKGIFLIIIIVRMIFMSDKTFDYLNYFIITDKVYGLSSDSKNLKKVNPNNKIFADLNLLENKNVATKNINSSNNMITTTQYNDNSLLNDNLRVNKLNDISTSPIYSSNNDLSVIDPYAYRSNLLKKLNDKNINVVKNSKFDIKTGIHLNNENAEIRQLSNNNNDCMANNTEYINIKNNVKTKNSINNVPILSLDNSKIKISSDNNEEKFPKIEGIKNLKNLKNLKEFKKSKFSFDNVNEKNQNSNENLNFGNLNINDFEKLKTKNTSNFNESIKKYPKNFEVLARNYLCQKEILKLVTDFSLLRSIIFNHEQNIEFEEMSRNFELITKVMIQKEIIFQKLLSDAETNEMNIEKIDNSNAIMKLNEI
jgi:hypothetical protein